MKEAPEYLYAVLALNTEVGVSMLGMEEEVKLSFAPNMVGAIPVFDNIESAKAYAGDRYEVMMITAKKPEHAPES